ncbi:MAG: UDP-N-acetylmuramoyl-tripeptide--D-alanyl-D-alanine ligase [Bacteroidaceae bacterium]|nr:UDP-N-acetylmuramoyl-tripeptide--D-alanyl-D-alanine ligase [Bacteroidaceae bacterium]
MTTDALYQIYLAHSEVTTDSRRCPAGSMFFALKGESFDGNRFAAQALEAGAAVAVVDDGSVVPAGEQLTTADGMGHYIVVPDVLRTLQALAAHHRRQFRGPVVEVTGTNGKTTTKELLAAVLSKKYKVLYTQGNLNNHIGVPLTLLRLRLDQHEVAVVETGANHPGEIRQLAEIVDPDYGLVTNVGRAHLEGFGSFDGVKRTKGELYDYLKAKSSGRLFVNESNYDLQDMLVKRGIDIDTEKCITYAREQALTMTWNCEGDVVDCSPWLRMWWRPKYGAQQVVQTHLIGAYNADNVLAAICVGLHFDVEPAAISAALEAYVPSLGRSEYRRTERNELIVDAYNANLTSMLAALDNFQRISHPHKMLVLGDMKELGAASKESHQRVADAALESGAEVAWFVGEAFSECLGEMKMSEHVEVRTFEDVAAVKRALEEETPAGKLILIKGSNSTRLHQLPELL